MINFTAGLFVGIFCLNSGAFGYLHSVDACLSSGKEAEQVRLSSEVIFIDPAVPDAATIEAHLPEGAEVVRLLPAMDGVAQISAHLAEKGNLSVIRIISHGNGGYFVLNGKRIDRNFLREHGNRITPWGRALADKGDILLYACNLAATDEGKAFVEDFVALTGADVAASTDRTGWHRSSGIGYQISNHGPLITENSSLMPDSNWDLEFHTGNIETAAIVVDEYQHHLATYTVTSDADSGTNTLRQAIIDANASGEDDTVNIQESIATITIGSQLPEIVAAGGALTINGGDGVIVKVTTPGTSTYRVFEINASDKTINISKMTIQGGDISEEGLAPAGYGGGVYIAAGTINLDAVTISGSKAYRGGGIYNAATIETLTTSTISENATSGEGGHGGGIYNTGTLNISNSTIFSNTAEYVGGGIYFSGTSTVCTIKDSTIAENTSQWDVAGGIYLDATGGTLTVKNTIIANNHMVEGHSDFAWNQGTLIDNGYNVVESQNHEGQQFSAETDLLNTDPTGLAEILTYEGGYTKVLKVTAGNILDNHGSTTETTGQRGYYRAASIPATRGAYQYNGVVAKIGDDTPWTGEAAVYTTIDAAYDAASSGDIIELAGTAILESNIDLDESNIITIRRDNALSTTTYVQASETSGTASGRVFNITEGTVTLEEMNIRYGNVEGNGGGINNETNLTLSNVAITDNTSTDDGGGINNNGTLTLSNTNTLSGNVADGAINGIHLDDGSSTSMGSSTLNNEDGIASEETVIFDSGESTVNYDGASQTILAVPYYNLTLSGTEDKTANSDIVVAGVFTNINALTITGDLQVDGISSIGANVITTGTQDYNSAVTLTDDATFAASDSNITFSNTIDGGFDLTLAAGTGNITLANHIGGINAIETLTLTSGNFDTAGNNITAGALIVNGDVFNNSGAAGTWRISGDVTIAVGATLNAPTDTISAGNDDTFYVGGKWDNKGNCVHVKGTVEFNGATKQELTSSGDSFYKLTLNNTNAGVGIELQDDTTVSDGLTLTEGLLDTNGKTLIASSDIKGKTGDTAIEDFDAEHMIVTNGTGSMRRVLSEPGSCLFPVGDNTGTAEYSPATLNFTSGTFAAGGYAAVALTNAKQPQNPNSTNYLSRHWTITQDGITGFWCDTTFNYVPADVQGTEADIYGGQYRDSDWTVLGQVDTSSHKFQATVTSFSDFTGVDAAAPTTQSSNIGFSNVDKTQMAVNWTRGNGDNVLVVAHEGSAVDSHPVDGTDYNANATLGGGNQIGTGNYVVYKGTGTSVIVIGLTAGTVYYFRAYEYNETGIEERYRTNTTTNNPSNKTTMSNAPGMPSATAATSITETEFIANWNATTGATGYRLDVSTQNDFGSYVSGYHDKDVGNVNTRSVTGLSGGTTYYYRLRAVNAGGTSGNSNTVNLTTNATVPIATAATTITETSFSANWNAATGATGYRLDVSINSDFGSYVSGYQNKDVGNVTTSTVTGLSPATDYSYQVRAYLGGGVSANSNSISVTTPDGTGVPAEIQDAAPNNGDGNGDGIKDSKQTTVASLLSATTGASYLTVELVGCGQIENVMASTYTSVGKADPGYDYPFDLVRFNIPCENATVRIYYYGATSLEGYVYRKYGPTPDDWNAPIWYTMPGFTFGTKTIGGKTVPYVEFLLTEAQLGDDTPVFPIVDQGGIARANAIPTLNEWGMIVLALLLIGMTARTLRRRKVED